MSPAELRPERPGDEAAIFALEAAAFGQTNEARLVDALRGSVSPLVSLVAEIEGRVVGHVLVSPVSLESAAGSAPVTGFGGLGPIGVEPARQGTGIGSALARAALAASEAAGFGAVFLVGNPLYYRRFGFELAGPRGFHYPNAAHDPVFQLVELTAGALEGHAGLVHFPAAFAQLE